MKRPFYVRFLIISLLISAYVSLAIFITSSDRRIRQNLENSHSDSVKAAVDTFLMKRRSTSVNGTVPRVQAVPLTRTKPKFTNNTKLNLTKPKFTKDTKRNWTKSMTQSPTGLLIPNVTVTTTTGDPTLHLLLNSTDTCYGLCSPENGNGTVHVEYVANLVTQKLGNGTNGQWKLDNISIQNRHSKIKHNRTWVITKATFSQLGTQPKLILHLKMNNGENRSAIFKPKLYDRNWTYKISCTGYDRDNGELGAYYLAKTMENFVELTQVIGVRLDLERDIWPVRDQSPQNSSWINNGSYCIKFVCKFCSDLVICGEGEKKSILEGSLSFWSPKKLWEIENPWSGTCTQKGEEKWRNDTGLCLNIKRHDAFYNDTKTLLDVVDAGIFDFLIDNPDRHHFEYWEEKIGNNGEFRRAFVLLDNGKAFSHPDREDDFSILAALIQCCIVRKSTYLMLKKFQKYSNLAKKFETVMASDPIYPFLDSRHGLAVQRRLDKAIVVIQMCIDTYGKSAVLIKS